MSRELERATRPLRTRLRTLLARGVLRLLRDAGAVQMLQVEVLKGEIRGYVPRVQQYGFNSLPLEGAHPVVILAPSGEASRAMAIAVDDARHRPRAGEPGESGIYDYRGNRIRLLDGKIRIDAVADLELEVAADVAAQAATVAITVTGACTVTAGGTITLESTDVELGAGAQLKLCDERLIAYLAAHTHTGVTAGGASTGPPSAPPAVGTHTTTETTAA